MDAVSVSYEVIEWTVICTSICLAGAIISSLLAGQGIVKLFLTSQKKKSATIVAATMALSGTIVLCASVFLMFSLIAHNSEEYAKAANAACQEYGIENRHGAIACIMQENDKTEVVEDVILCHMEDGETVMSQGDIIVSACLVQQDDLSLWKTAKRFEVEFYENTTDDEWKRMEPLHRESQANE